MTKQQIVAQLAAAKLTQSGFLPGEGDLYNFGFLADKIIEMFPEHDYSVAESPLTLYIEGKEYHLSAEDIKSIGGE